MELGIAAWQRNHHNVFLLAACQALYLSSSSTCVTLSGLVGSTLAPSRLLATLPYSLIPVMTATATVPVSFLMARIGRQRGFMLGAFIGGLGGAVSTWAIFHQSFVVFCLGNAAMGCFQAVAQYYRFAAADAADAAFKSRAVAWVLAGGVAAALIGPAVASSTKDLFAPVMFAGAYLAITAMAGLTIALLALLDLPETASTRVAAAAAARDGRPLSVITRQPAFLVAVANSLIGYAVMAFMMTASPLAAVACGLGDAAAFGIIRMHLIGMFLPSFVSGNLIRRFGVTPALLTGNLLLVVAAATALSGVTLWHFWVALLLLGVGWNFMYVGGTTLLTTTYRPEERAKTQAANEFLTFGAVALASLSAGGVFGRYGWEAIAGSVLPLLGVVLAVTLWHALARGAAWGRAA